MIAKYQNHFEFLKRKFDANTIAHAYLLSGGKNEEKKDFINKFATYIHCQFPDFLTLQKQADKDVIIIDQIKKIQEFLNYKSFHGGHKIIFVEDSDYMNIEAQSCFLKTLEEPTEKTIIFLSLSKPDLVLPTIHSRCQSLNFSIETQPDFELEEEKELNKLIAVLNASLSEKFKYVRQVDADGKNVKNILILMERHLRILLLGELETKIGKYSIKEIAKSLNLIDEINKKLIFTNASPRLALETLLMDINL